MTKDEEALLARAEGALKSWDRYTMPGWIKLVGDLAAALASATRHEGEQVINRREQIIGLYEKRINRLTDRLRNQHRATAIACAALLVVLIRNALT